MFEALLMRSMKKNILADYLLDLHFEDEILGTKILTDKSPNPISLPLIGTTPTSGFGVMDHPSIGRCFQFNGTNFFYNTANALSDFSKDSFDLEIGYIKPNTTQGVFFTTGRYTTSAVKGMTLHADQYTDTSFQAVLIDNSTYRRHLFNGANTQNYTEFLVEKRSTGITITNKTTGAKQTYSSFTAVGDTYLTIGGYRDGTACFKGYLKYFKIKKVIEV